MKVEMVTVNTDQHVALEGAHSVAWANLLDLIYSDAYHQAINDLQFIVGHPEVIEPIQLRAELTPTKGKAPRRAMAQLVTSEMCNSAADVDVIYTVEYGQLSTKALRRRNPVTPLGRMLDKQFSVFTWQARAMGIPIRLAGMCRQPQLYDRYMKYMQTVFTREAVIPAYYHLKIWT